jgi:hypothetical protein
VDLLVINGNDAVLRFVYEGQFGVETQIQAVPSRAASASDRRDEPGALAPQESAKTCPYASGHVQLARKFLAAGSKARQHRLGASRQIPHMMWDEMRDANEEGRRGPLTEQTAESYAATFDTNVLGTVLCLKHELRVMQAQGRGSIINLSSTAGHKAGFRFRSRSNDPVG